MKGNVMALLDEMRVLERLQFFDGQRLFASDLQGLEAFNREMRWLHNRSLHQIGIANGFAVRGAKGDRVVRVEAGLALDLLGREIVLIEDEELSVPPVSGDPGGEPAVFDLVVSYPDDANLEQVETRQGVCVPRGVVRLQERPVFCWVRLKRNLNGDLVPETPLMAREIEQGLRIVIARAEVLNCQLYRDLSLAERRSARPALGAHLGCGAFAPDPWELFWWIDRDRLLEAVFNLLRSLVAGAGVGLFTASPFGAFTTALFSLDTAFARSSLLGALGPLVLPVGLRARVPTASACFLTTPHYWARLDGERLLPFDLVTLLVSLDVLDPSDPALSAESREQLQKIRSLTAWPVYVEGLVEVLDPLPAGFQARLALMVQLLEIPNFSDLREIGLSDELREHVQGRFEQTEIGQQLEKCRGLSGAEQEDCLRELARMILEQVEETVLELLAPLSWRLVWLGVEG